MLPENFTVWLVSLTGHTTLSRQTMAKSHAGASRNYEHLNARAHRATTDTDAPCASGIQLSSIQANRRQFKVTESESSPL
jgi:hypothetical protein